MRLSLVGDMTYTICPDCCTAIHISYFDSYCPFDEYDEEEDDYTENRSGLEAFKTDIQEIVEYHSRLALIIAITESESQFEIEEALQDLGFLSTGPFEKKQHADTVIKLWHGHIPELIRKNGWKERQPKAHPYDPD